LSKFDVDRQSALNFINFMEVAIFSLFVQAMCIRFMRSGE